MNAYGVKLRYYKMHIYIYIYIFIFISSFKAQFITNIYLNRKNMNLIIENYPKQ